MKKPNKVIDPSKPLKNVKHEIMARELAKGSSQVDAYRKVYPNASDVTTNAIASRTINDNGINERALRLLEKAGLSEGKLAGSLNDCVDDDDKRIKLDATKFALGMIGYGKEQKIAESSYNPVQIIIEQFTNVVQVPVPKEDTTKDVDK
jgi:hypothetical protein